MASDGSVSTVAPWGHIVSTDTVSYSVLADIDPVLGESYPVPGKQKTEIGGDLANRFEWRYFMRRAPGAKPRSQGMICFNLYRYTFKAVTHHFIYASVQPRFKLACL